VLSKKELLRIAGEMKEICSAQNVLFIVNDHLDIALACNADGMHLGQDDLPTAVARRLLPIDMILGRSTNTVEQAVTAEAEGADYIGVGSIYPTISKEKAVVVTPDRIREVKKVVNIPIIAIGGIDKNNAAAAMAAGADSVAVINAILESEQPEKATRNIVKAIEAVSVRNNR
jgi:thiamine-phosphate diphosphorylase